MNVAMGARALGWGALFVCGWVSTATSLAASAVSPVTLARITAVESCLPDAVVVIGQPRSCETLAQRMRDWHVHGVSVVVIHNGAIDWAKGYGMAGDGGEAVTTQTLFQAGSISKPVAAMAALRLVKQGKLSLDTDVNTMLQRWKLPASAVAPGAVVTLRELLSHTSGLGVHGFPGYSAGKPLPSLVQVLNGEPPANTEAVRLEAKPASQWNYSGGGYTVVQLLMEDVSRQSFVQLLHETVIAPLGMVHSTFAQPLPASMQASVATPYDVEGHSIPGGAHVYPEKAAAGLWTTPSDLALYVQDLQRSIKGSGRVLGQAMARRMLTPGKGKWGLGLSIGGSPAAPYFQHFGVNDGFESLMFGYRDKGEGVVIMTNATGGAALARDLLRSIAVVYAWPDYVPVERAAVKLEPSVLARYVGTYRVDSDLDIRIRLDGGRLISQLTDQHALPLFPASRVKFFTRENSEFEFLPDSRGGIEEVVFHQGGHDLKGKRVRSTQINGRDG
ncbi:serine hydrolase [Dyella telluris]|uniref:Serine hydrolase n=1 Tax=Dyella telluris TaxID=2763498 RepID=A0A7G8Q644_9GAMM|nr:serine hydrolase [Dyella telluris]QNK02252.1 serine hydrolase [Dyella telluris]